MAQNATTNVNRDILFLAQTTAQPCMPNGVRVSPSSLVSRGDNTPNLDSFREDPFGPIIPPIHSFFDQMASAPMGHFERPSSLLRPKHRLEPKPISDIRAEINARMDKIELDIIQMQKKRRLAAQMLAIKPQGIGSSKPSLDELPNDGVEDIGKQQHNRSWFPKIKLPVEMKFDDHVKQSVDIGVNELKKFRTLLVNILPKFEEEATRRIADTIIIFLTTAYESFRSSSHADRWALIYNVVLAHLGPMNCIEAGARMATHLASLVTYCVSHLKIFRNEQKLPVDIELPDIPEEGIASQGLKNLYIPEAYAIVKGLFESLLEICSNMWCWMTGKEPVSILTSQGVKTREGKIHKLAKELHDVTSISKAIQYIIGGVWEAMQYSYLTIFKKPLYVSGNKELVERATNWMVEYESYLEQSKNDEVLISSEFCVQVVDHMKKGLEINRNLVSNGFTRNNFTPFFKAFDDLKDLAAKCHNLLTGAKPRVEPLCVQLSGRPGVGKTTATNYITHDLYAFYCELIGMKPNTDNIVWPFEVENEHKEGFAHQFCTLFDDYMQADDPEVRRQIAMTIIKMKNVAPYPLHMGRLEDKGSMFFDSKLLLLTTNQMKLPKNVQIQNEDAFKRRIDFVLEMERDHSKFDANGKLLSGHEFDRDCYIVHIHDKFTYAKIETVRYPEMLRRLCLSLKERIAKKDSLVNWIKSNPVDFSKLMAQSGEIQLLKEDFHAVESTNGTTHKFAKGDRIVAERYYRDGFYTHVNQDVYWIPHSVCESTPDKQSKTSESFFVNTEELERTEREASYKVLYQEVEERFKVANDKIANHVKELKAWSVKAKEELDASMTENTYLKYIVAIGAVLATITVLIKTVSWFNGENDPVLASEGGATATGASKDTSTRKIANLKTKGTYQRGRRRAVSTQGDDGLMELMKGKILNNMGTIDFYNSPTEGGHRCGFIFLRDQTFMTAKHMLEGIDIDTGYFVLTLCKDKTVHRFTLRECKRQLVEDDDVVFITVPKIPPMADIVDHFASDDEISDANLGHTVLMIPNPLATPMYEMMFSTCTRAIGNVKYTYSEDSKVTITSSSIIAYASPTVNGNCGGIVATMNNKLQHKLIGLHVAGGDSIGCAVSITRELLAEAGLTSRKEHSVLVTAPKVATQGYALTLDGLDIPIQEFEGYLDYTELTRPQKDEFVPTQRIKSVLADLETHVPHFDYGENQQFLGNVRKELSSRFPKKSKIIPSPWHGRFSDPFKLPALLHNDKAKGLFPLQQGLTKVNNPYPATPIDKDLLKEATVHTLNSIPCPFPPRLLSWDEVIHGVETWPFTRGLHMNTAEGFTVEPKHGQTAKKRSFIPNPNLVDRWLMTEELSLRLSVREKQYEDMNFGNSIWITHLKDELRPAEKVEQGKTRLYEGGELEHLMIGRRYLGAFLECVALSRQQCGVAAGINPHSIDWRNLYKKHADMNEAGVPGSGDLDASNYDWSHDPEVQAAVRWMIHAWYLRWEAYYGLPHSEHVWKMREGVMREAMDFIILQIGLDLMHPLRGFVSGMFATFVINSLHGLILHKYGYLRAYRQLRIEWEGDCSNFFHKYCNPAHGSLTQWAIRTNGFKDPIVLDEHLAIDTAGDDLLLTVSALANWYGFNAIIYMMSTRGLTYTTADKGVGDYHHKHISECTFLKRAFVDRNGQMFAPMPIPDCLEIVNWMLENSDARKAMYEQCVCAVLELAHHGKLVAEHWKEKFNQELILMGAPCVDFHYEQWMIGIFENMVLLPPEMDIKRMHIVAQAGRIAADRKPMSHKDECDDDEYPPTWAEEIVIRRRRTLFVQPVAQPTSPTVRHIKRKAEIMTSQGVEGAIHDEYDSLIKRLIEVTPKLRHIDTIQAEIQETIGAINFLRGARAPRLNTEKLGFLESFENIVKSMELLAEVKSLKSQSGKAPLGTLANQFYALYNFKPELVYERLHENWVCVGKLFDVRIVSDPFGTKQAAMQDWYLKMGRQFKIIDHTYTRIQYTASFMTRIEEKYPPDGAQRKVTVSKVSPIPDIEDPPVCIPSKNPQVKPNLHFEKAFGLIMNLQDKLPEQDKGTLLSSLAVIKSHERNLRKGMAEVMGKESDFYEEDDVNMRLLKAGMLKLHCQSAEVPPQQEAIGGQEETVGLTTYSDTHGVEPVPQEVGVTSLPVLDIDPYTKQNFGSLTDRSYDIGSFTWLSTDPVDSTKLTLIMPYDLIEAAGAAQLKARLKYFNWWNADFEFEFRVNGTMYHCGRLAISGVPHYGDTTTDNWKLNNRWTASQCNMRSLSAASAQVEKYLLKYQQPKPYHYQGDNTRKPYMGHVRVWVLNSLNMLGATAAVQVQVTVTCRLKNFRPAGFTIHAQSMHLPLTDSATYNAYEADDLFDTEIDDDEVFDWMQVGHNEVPFGNVMWGALTEVYATEEGYLPNTAAVVYQEALDPTTSWQLFDQMLSSCRLMAQMKKEQMQKSEKGLLSTALDVGSNIASVVSAVPINPTISLAAGVVGKGLAIGAGIARKLGLSKPQDISTRTRVNQQTTTNMSYGVGCETGYDMSLSPENAVASGPENFGMTVDEHNIKYLAMKPGLIDQWQFDGSYDPNDVLKTYKVTPMICARYRKNLGGTAGVPDEWYNFQTPAAAVAYNFQYGRTGQKFLLELVCCKFVTGRIRVTWHPTITECPAVGSPLTFPGELGSQVFDFAGDTLIPFTIPYMQNQLYMRMEEPMSPYATDVPFPAYNGMISISLVNPPVSNQTTMADSVVQVNVWTACDKDCDFQVPANRYSYDQTNTLKLFRYPLWTSGTIPGGFTFYAQGGNTTPSTTMNYDEIFKNDFPPLVEAKHVTIKNLCSGEQVEDIRQLLHRFTSHAQTMDTTQAPTVLDYSKIWHGTDCPLNYFEKWALYHKGSRYFKMVRVSTTTGFVNGTWGVALEPCYYANGLANLIVFDQANKYRSGLLGRNGMLLQTTDISNGVEWRMPWYNKNNFVMDEFNQVMWEDEKPDFTQVVYFQPADSASGKATVQLLMAAGDDYALACFIGAPIIFVSSSAAPDPS